MLVNRPILWPEYGLSGNGLPAGGGGGQGAGSLPVVNGTVPFKG